MGRAKTAKFVCSPLDTRDCGDGKNAILLAPVRFYSAKLGRTVVAPAGMKTDFASIPRGVWNVIPKRGKHDRAAVIHDAGYRGFLKDILGNPLHVSKQVSDDLFDEGMRVDGVSLWQRVLMYRAVRLFGRPTDKKVPHGV